MKTAAADHILRSFYITCTLITYYLSLITYYDTTYLPLITYYYFMNNVSMYRQGSELPFCFCEMPKFKKIWWPNALIYI